MTLPLGEVPKIHITRMDSKEALTENNSLVDENHKNTISDASKSETISAQDAFVTIQTKDGQSSQKIPLCQFLEKVVGVKFENTIELDLSRLLGSKADERESVSDEDIESTPSSRLTPDTNDVGLAGNGEINTKDTKVINNSLETNKPRGRGRPRKTKVKEEQTYEDLKQNVILKTDDNKDKGSNMSSLQQPRDNLSVNSPQHLRRSRRTPARNSRFKEDFVDSSTLWSKGSSSWNTQLMTLALAAERHETKPNKPGCISRKRNTLSVGGSAIPKTKESVSNNQDPKCIDDKDADVENDSSEDAQYGNQKKFVDVKENSALDNYKPSGHVFKRPLDIALNLAISGTRDYISEKPLTHNIEKEDDISNASYYVIMEPQTDASGQGLVVEKTREGIEFNVADMCCKDSSSNLNPSSASYPQDRFFVCNSCDLIFSSASSWHIHCKQVHGQSSDPLEFSQTLCRDIHQCLLCEEKFPYQFMLDIHMKKNNHVDKSISCSSCNIVFSSSIERQMHWLENHSSHSCNICGKQFSDIVSLRRHMKSECPNASLQDNTNDIADGIPQRDEEEEEMSDSMELVFQDKDKLSLELTSNPLEKITCDLCNLKFSTYSGLWHHKLDVHQQFYPSGFKEKLLERLERNENILKSTLPSDPNISKENGKNKYFIIMQPKWLRSRPQLKVNTENKEFKFSVADNKEYVDLGEKWTRNTNSTSYPTKNSGNSGVPKRIEFDCGYCGESFHSAAKFREHSSQVHGECFEVVRYLGAFQCSQCSDTFPCQFMLDEHIKQHADKKPLPCTLCGLSFHRIQERREHWKKSHPGVGCPNCGKMYASIKYLQKHISLNCQDHYPASKRSIEFQKKHHSDFEMEDSEKKVEKKILKCHLCPKICSSIHCWRRHMSENHEDDGFSKLSNACIICNKVIYGYKALEKHLLQEHAEESGLPIEEENSIVTEALKRSKVDIIDYRKAGKDNTNVYQDEEGLYHCPECPKTHTDLKALMIHIKTHVNMQLECSICKKTFKNPTLLKQHIMRHRTKAVYTCNTCGKKFVTLQKLNKHNKVHHSKKESYVCELCGMSFALNDYLLKHKRCHTDKRPHSCSVCGKTFRTKPELRVHVLIHTQETPYVCEHCGRGFTQKGNWRIHLAQHTGHKPHKCNQCELSFALPSHLKRHVLTHNQKVNYRCIWCEKECTQRKHMQMHVTRVHKEDFFQYEEHMKLETPVPIAPSQLKMYNRRLGKAGQVRRAYRTRAKKCNTTSQDIMKGVTKVEEMDDDDSENVTMETIIEPLVETVTTDLALAGQDVQQDGSLQILVSGDHQSYVKNNVTGELMGDDSSNVEIVMGDNNEINIIINNGDPGMGNDLAVQETLDESVSAVALPQFSESSAQLHGSLQQAVNALVVSGSKSIGGEETMALDIETLAHNTDTYAIVYPS